MVACYDRCVVIRIVMVAALILAFGRANGVFWFGDACTEDCSDDCGDGKQCPPGCPTCTCAPATQSMPTPHTTVTDPARDVQRVVFVAPAPFITSPDPRDIVHVPKPDA